MWKSVAIVTAVGFLFSYFLQYRDWLGWNRQIIYKTAPGPCRYIATGDGSEDMRYIGNNVIIMSSGFGKAKGMVKSLNLDTNEMANMTILGAPNKEDFMTSPHGITTWKDENGNIYLYVITHPKAEDRVEVFKIKNNSELIYQKTITDPSFAYMNDLVAVGLDKFYITKFYHFRGKTLGILEYMTQNAWGGIIYYDGKKGRAVVPSGLLLPNGINISPDGKMVYVSGFGTRELLGFHRAANNDLTKAWTFDADTLVDNIDVDPDTGDLWIGCHPVAYRIFSLMIDMIRPPLPSQVLRFKMEDNMVSKVDEIYADEGTELFGSSVATFVKGKLVIGTVNAQTLICDVTYLSE